MKAFNALSALCAIIGVPFAGLVWLAGSMTSVPRFDAEQMAVCLPLPIAAALFGSIPILRSRLSVPRQIAPKWTIKAVVASLITVVVIVATYFDMKGVRLF